MQSKYGERDKIFWDIWEKSWLYGYINKPYYSEGQYQDVSSLQTDSYKLDSKIRVEE